MSAISDLQFDVVVVGGGHAGAEAAWAAARLGARTALITHQRTAIGRMSCNPAIGGIGKGQIVREIDALGGLMGVVSDEACIQFRMLNRRKGPALWAPRAQADSQLYPQVLQRYLTGCPNLTLIEGGVDGIRSERLAGAPSERRITGVLLTDGRTIAAPALVIASGTFLRGLMHCGEDRTAGGRVGEKAAISLSDALRDVGLQLGRLKTGTCPRIERDSVALDRLEQQPGDAEPCPFSFLTDRITQPQVCCWIVYTSPAIHTLIRENIERAPLYTGQIESTGPRYCPSIETKIVRFADKERHQIFVEPEGRDSDRLYLNGLSTSLPRDVQAQMVRALPAFENARVLQWGYAVEYDYVPPEQTDPTLMTKRVRGLFLAGQINGTSGYEEAAGQGIVAGINAARFVAERPLVTLTRDNAYIGVMLDDLATRGLIEPYRMFSSRAEHRLHLRYDNADTRLTPLGREVGLVDDVRWTRYVETHASLDRLIATLRATRVDGRALYELLRRPDEDGLRYRESHPDLIPWLGDSDVWRRAVVLIKYASYIERQRESVDRFRELEAELIPAGIDYDTIPHLRAEARDRWNSVRPLSLGQASRVSGIKPTDVATLVVFLASRQRRARHAQA